MPGNTIDSNDFAGANSKIEQMTNAYSTHDNLPATLIGIAIKYRDKGFANNKDNDSLLRSASICENLINSYPDYKSIPAAKCCAGDCYFALGQKAKALAHYESVVDTNPEFKYVWHAHSMVGLILEGLMNEGVVTEAVAKPKIRAAYEAVIQKHPDSQVAELANNWLNNN
jgi:tetratricopeptide (TPR) repeat protein